MKQQTLFDYKPTLACLDKRGSVGGHQRHLEAGEVVCDECHKSHKEYQREWQRKRRSNPAERSKDNSAKRQTRSREVQRKWRQSPAGKAITAKHSANRRAKNAGAKSEDYDRAALLKDALCVCPKCGAPATTLDHIQPIKRGGDDVATNLQPMCRQCNSSKHLRFDECQLLRSEHFHPADVGHHSARQAGVKAPNRQQAQPLRWLLFSGG